MVPPSTRRTHIGRKSVSDTDESFEAKLRRDIGLAWVAIDTTCERASAALDLKSHTSIVQYRQGLGPFGDVAVKLDRLERNHISVEPILEKLRVIALAARFDDLDDEEVQRRLSALLIAEHELQGREDAGTMRAAATGCPRTLIVAMSPETDAQLEIIALAMVCEDRGLRIRVAH